MMKRLFLLAVLFLACGGSITHAEDSVPKDGSNHDLSKAKVMDRVILAVIEHYYDPSRVEPVAMFKGAMDALSEVVAEVVVEMKENDTKAVVGILEHQIIIDVANIKSPWALSRVMRRVLKFLHEKLPKDKRDYRVIEYAAVNGLLSVLDPHSGAMMPDIWGELMMSTQGEFEGIGIRITTDRRPPCSGALTVVDVFEGSPASRANVRRGDRIMRIDGESIVNITTSEAAKRLRGKPGTKVVLNVKRANGKKDKLIVTRGKIPISSVKWKMLESDVGYVAIEGFQRNTDSELKEALKGLRAKNMKGLILDLRGNPGGLLGAAIEIGDLFLSSGTIVATAGRRNDDRVVSNASSSGTEPSYPMVILIDSGSASAAELLAGAIRNHGRALLIGGTTFGKGSVQEVIPLPNGGGLRLTIAQYLTPGDISIQAIGVSPDVRFKHTFIDREKMNLGSSVDRRSENDLAAHLVRPSNLERKDRQNYIETMMLVPTKEWKADEEMFKRCYTKNAERKPFRYRFETEFARTLLSETKGTTSAELMLTAKRLIEEKALERKRNLSSALKRIGVDWGATGDNAPLDDNSKQEVSKYLKASAQLQGKIVPGEKVKIKVTVKNNGKKTIHQLRGTTKSDNWIFNRHDLVLGKLKPGKSRSWSVIVEVPPIISGRVDPVKIEFASDDRLVPEPISIDITMPKMSAPQISYNWHLEDKGNGNGYVEPGEELSMHVRVKNVGKVVAKNVSVNLSAKPGVDVSGGNFAVGPLRPGKEIEGVFKLKIKTAFSLKVAKLKLEVEEWLPSKFPVGRTLLSNEIEIDVTPIRPGPSSASGTITVKSDLKAALYAAPSNEGRVVAHASPGSGYAIDAVSKEFFKVVLGKDHHAWIAKSNTRPGGKVKPDYEEINIQPPKIYVSGSMVRRVDSDKIRLKGRVEHSVKVMDLIVFVGNKKIAYLPGHDGSGSRELLFDLDIPIEEGANKILLMARHNRSVIASELLFVRSPVSEKSKADIH